MLIWLSFADPDKPRGQQFLGACVVEVDESLHDDPRSLLWEAMQEAWRQGCNPGGSVMPTQVREECWPEGDRNRLLSPMEVRERELGSPTRRETMH